jgi:hypothetical protein
VEKPSTPGIAQRATIRRKHLKLIGDSIWKKTVSSTLMRKCRKLEDGPRAGVTFI